MTGLLARGVATDPIERLKSELLAVGIDPASRSETLSAGHRRIIGFWLLTTMLIVFCSPSPALYPRSKIPDQIVAEKGASPSRDALVNLGLLSRVRVSFGGSLKNGLR